MIRSTSRYLFRQIYNVFPQKNYRRSYLTTNNSKNSTDIPSPSKYKLSKELEDLGVYLPKDEEYYDDVDEEYDEPEEKEQEVTLDNNEKSLDDMLYKIKNNYELQESQKEFLRDEDFESFEQMEKRIEENLKKKYKEKVQNLSELSQIDPRYKDEEQVKFYNKLSENFIPVDQHYHHQPPPSGSTLDSRAMDSNDVTSRISKIKERIQKEKLNRGRLSFEEIENLFSLYREDPKKYNLEVLADKFAINQHVLTNILRYSTTPIVVRYNTGLKTAHWNVIFEK
ncbi:hypothetical protein DLAC_08937 [Tieghemostelium lacteum]|uniref:Uncharacterized protein n=1 Tax=Tieghemostelium lacteum TaxID=361077 RepID=A0A151Z8P3_TIELA|nr:hypothetical protein DLAC_08937 [Tieghemostelium lacteum]|eukprot:KYQ90330.1 hypothetical protein DLAC_08937 [Tieghemostelium lacteum]